MIRNMFFLMFAFYSAMSEEVKLKNDREESPDLSELSGDVYLLKKTMAILQGHIDRFESLYINRLDQKLTSIAINMANVDSNVRNIQDRAHVWDTFQLHISAWNEQIKSIDKKADLISSQQEKLMQLEGKINFLMSLDYNSQRTVNKLSNIENKLDNIMNMILTKATYSPVYEEFALRGAFSTLKDVEFKIDAVQTVLNKFVFNSTNNVEKIHNNETATDLDEIVKDMASKIDLIHDKIIFGNTDDIDEYGNKDDATLERISEHQKIILNSTQRLLMICGGVPDERFEQSMMPSESPSNISSKFIEDYMKYGSEFCRQSTLRCCDDDGIIIQRRTDGSVNFTQFWDDYKWGFGDVEGDFWIGNEGIHALTSGRNVTLNIRLQDFIGGVRSASYYGFKVADEDSGYRMEFESYSGDAGDALVYHNGSKFSTVDVINTETGQSCPSEYGGGWWFKNCLTSNLNGLYYDKATVDDYKGIIWSKWKEDVTLAQTKMSIAI